MRPTAARNTSSSTAADPAETTCDLRDDASLGRLRRKLFCFALRELRSEAVRTRLGLV